MRLLGNTALLEPLDVDTQVSSGGLVLVNIHKKPTLKFRVLAVGPGGYVKRRKKRVFLTPEVEVGDCVIIRAELDSELVKESFDDGTGRVIVNAAGILAKWRSP